MVQKKISFSEIRALYLTIHIIVGLVSEVNNFGILNNINFQVFMSIISNDIKGVFFVRSVYQGQESR